MSEEQNTEQIFAIIIPSEASLTAPIAAGVELSKLFIMAAKKVQQLSQQTRIVPDVDGDGELLSNNITVIDNPDLKWWFDQSRKIASDVAKITANIQAKDIENRIKVADIFLNSDILNKKQQEEFVKMALIKKMSENE